MNVMPWMPVRGSLLSPAAAYLGSKKGKGNLVEGYLIELTGLMFSAMAALGTVIIAMLLMRMWRSYELENRARRVERTLSALQIPEHISETLAEVLWFRHSHSDGEGFDLDNAKVFGALAYFENLAIGIRAGVYDERLAFDRLGDVLPRFYFTIVKTVYQSRSEGTAPSLYVQLERLAREWRSKGPTHNVNVSEGY